MPKICLTTYFDKKFEPLGKHCLNSLKVYADKYNYNVEINNNIQSDRPPSWNKILIIQQLFKKGYDYVFWVDADALFVRFNQDIAQEIEQNKNLYISNIKIKKIKMPNMGVFLIKNNEWSENLLNQLWKMKEYTHHHMWEQAAFWDIYKQQNIFEKIKWLPVKWNTYLLSKRFIMNYRGEASKAIIAHFPCLNYYLRLLGMNCCSLSYKHQQNKINA